MGCSTFNNAADRLYNLQNNIIFPIKSRCKQKPSVVLNYNDILLNQEMEMNEIASNENVHQYIQRLLKLSL